MEVRRTMYVVVSSAPRCYGVIDQHPQIASLNLSTLTGQSYVHLCLMQDGAKYIRATSTDDLWTMAYARLRDELGEDVPGTMCATAGSIVTFNQNGLLSRVLWWRNVLEMRTSYDW